jgi:hypothetical protein
MLDDAAMPTSAPEPRCMWCSAVLPSSHETTCPSCGATLVGEGDASVPGLTAIDADAILRNARTASRSRPRGGRLLSWISGEYSEDDAAGAATPGSLSPPPADVRREMLRLELEAQVANAQAEAEALAADAAVEGGTPLARPDVDLDPGAGETAAADDSGASAPVMAAGDPADGSAGDVPPA